MSESKHVHLQHSIKVVYCCTIPDANMQMLWRIGIKHCKRNICQQGSIQTATARQSAVLQQTGIGEWDTDFSMCVRCAPHSCRASLGSLPLAWATWPAQTAAKGSLLRLH